MANLISVTIRIPKETRDELASRALGHEMALPEYLRQLLNAVVSMPEGVEEEDTEGGGGSEIPDDNPDTRTIQEKVAALMVRIRGGQ